MQLAKMNTVTEQIPSQPQSLCINKDTDCCILPLFFSWPIYLSLLPSLGSYPSPFLSASSSITPNSHPDTIHLQKSPGSWYTLNSSPLVTSIPHPWRKETKTQQPRENYHTQGAEIQTVDAHKKCAMISSRLTKRRGWSTGAGSNKYTGGINSLKCSDGYLVVIESFCYLDGLTSNRRKCPPETVVAKARIDSKKSFRELLFLRAKKRILCSSEKQVVEVLCTKPDIVGLWSKSNGVWKLERKELNVQCQCSWMENKWVERKAVYKRDEL